MHSYYRSEAQEIAARLNSSNYRCEGIGVKRREGAGGGNEVYKLSRGGKSEAAGQAKGLEEGTFLGGG